MSFHAGQTFTFGETPSATKWNYLWENDYALADGTGISDDAILQRHLADGIVNSDRVDWAASTGKIWWQELGRVTLGSNADSMDTGTIAARKYLQVLVVGLPSGSLTLGHRFNNDSGSNYGVGVSVSGAADITGTSLNALLFTPTTAVPQLHILDIMNIANQEKLIYGRYIERGTAGAGNLPGRGEARNKWADTTNQITRVAVNNSNTGDMIAGSELIVLGHN